MNNVLTKALQQNEYDRDMGLQAGLVGAAAVDPNKLIEMEQEKRELVRRHKIQQKIQLAESIEIAVSGIACSLVERGTSVAESFVIAESVIQTAQDRIERDKKGGTRGG